ncbi:MAG: hypothetical protein JW759_06010 [Candidatus Coatesbacteria bacterium]|nr:hypothetical protein [Candidatus Coatesbacteria bacterium]
MSALDEKSTVTSEPQEQNARGWACGKPPIKLAQGKMGALFAAVAGLIVLMFSIFFEKSITEACHSLVTSVLIFWLLGWCSAFAVNWHFRSAHKHMAETERKSAAEKKEDAKVNSAPSNDNVVDENQASPA